MCRKPSVASFVCGCGVFVCASALCVCVCGSKFFVGLCVSDVMLCVFVSTFNSISCAVTYY